MESSQATSEIVKKLARCKCSCIGQGPGLKDMGHFRVSTDQPGDRAGGGGMRPGCESGPGDGGHNAM